MSTLCANQLYGPPGMEFHLHFTDIRHPVHFAQRFIAQKHGCVSTRHSPLIHDQKGFSITGEFNMYFLWKGDHSADLQIRAVAESEISLTSSDRRGPMAPQSRHTDLAYYCTM